jgi:hypothetical protein
MCDELGWMYEPQAPQGKTYYCLICKIISWAKYCVLLVIGPYTNVLDLYLFPSMSHRHSAVLQRISNTELPLDRIWKTVEDVWKDTVSAEVARLCI